MDMTAALLVAAVIGAVAGWLAAQSVHGTGFGLLGDILVGIFGALIGSASCRDHRSNRGCSCSPSDRETDKAVLGVAFKERRRLRPAPFPNALLEKLGLSAYVLGDGGSRRAGDP